MCNLKIEAMDRAGELPLERNDEQGNEGNSHATAGRSGDLRPDGLRAGGDMVSADGSGSAVRGAIDQGPAARGEAVAESDTSSIQHDSDCSLHNMPAYPAGPCDCTAKRSKPDFATDEEWSLLGQQVEGSQNGIDWFAGELVEIIDLFAPYRISIDGRKALFQLIRPVISVSARAADAPSEPSEFRNALKSIDSLLRGKVCDPDPLPPMMPGAVSVTTTYGLVAGLLREVEQLRKAAKDLATAKNFHRSLCDRFGYSHDDQDWLRDLVSLEEFIAAKLSARAADAPSEPIEREKMLENALNLMLDEKADYMRLNKLGDPTCETTYRVAQRALNTGKSRAADALDSQPTDSTGAEAIFPPELPKFMPDFPFSSNEELWDHAVLTGWRAAQPDLLTYTVDGEVMSPVEYIDYMHRQYAGERLRADQGWERYASANKDRNALRAAMLDSRASSAPVAPIAPDGWKLVPIEADQAQLMAGRKQTFADMTGEHCGPSAENTYRAMVAAAPTPQQEGSEADNG